jgi:uncharacterized protein (TIGR02145 family)
MNFIFTLSLFLQVIASTRQQYYYEHPAEIPTVKIGEQEWTTMNWSYKTPKSFFYNNDSTLDAKYGRLYYYSNAVGATPPGFHLPTMEEWWQLITYLGGDNTAGKRMMEGGDSGLNLPFAGYKSANISDEDLYGFIDYYAFYWTATQDGEQTAYAVHIDNKYVIKIESYRRANAFSVRYIKNK